MPIETVTLSNFSGGLNLASPPWEIADNQLVAAQDVFVGRDGYIKGRGPVKQALAADGVNHLGDGVSLYNTLEPIGIASTQTPDGKSRSIFAASESGGTNIQLIAWNTNGSVTSVSSTGTLANFSLSGPTAIWNAQTKLGGGVFIGVSDGYTNSYTNRHMIVWNGAILADYTTGTMDCAANSRTVTGHSTLWSANVEPGMYLMASSGVYLGMVVQINSNTQLILDRPPPETITGGTYTLKSFRGFRIDTGGGLISTATDSTAVIGSETSFIGSGLNAFSWNIFRASDWTYIGTVSSVSTDTTLTLSGNAAIALTNEPFVAVRFDLSNSVSFASLTPFTAPGFLTTTYADRQWYANRSYADLGYGSWVDSAWFSESQMAEVLNTSPSDGNRIVLTETNPNDRKGIRGFQSAQNGIVVNLDSSTHIIGGTTPENFYTEKVCEDGSISAMSVCAYNGGVVWAGWQGIWYWDNGQPVNLVEKTMGATWRSMLMNFDPDKNRAWGFIYKDIYFLHIEKSTKGVNQYTSNDYTTGGAPRNDICFALHLPTNTLTVLSNFWHHGAAYMDISAGVSNENRQCVVALPIWNSGATAVNPFFATVGQMIEDPSFFTNDFTLTDAVTCALRSNGSTWSPAPFIGPNYYVETKWLSLGDLMRKKAWRSLLVMGKYGSNRIGSSQYNLLPVTVTGPDVTRAAISTGFGATANVFTTARLKYTRRATTMGIGLWHNLDSDFQIKGIAVGYKWLPPGRP